MNDRTPNFALGFAIGVIAALVLHCFVPCAQYRTGQIDALSGDVKYELVTHENKTMTWEEK